MKPNAREMTAIVASRSKMAKRKPKPATAGEKILKGVALHRNHYFELPKLSRRIDRAIARAVRKERERCMTIIDACRSGLIDMSRADEMIENGE